MLHAKQKKNLHQRPEKNFFSKVLKIAYTAVLTTALVKTPISPVPARAIGPVYHSWDIEGITIPNPPKKANRPAMPIGNLLGLSQSWIR